MSELQVAGDSSEVSESGEKEAMGRIIDLFKIIIKGKFKDFLNIGTLPYRTEYLYGHRVTSEQDRTIVYMRRKKLQYLFVTYSGEDRYKKRIFVCAINLLERLKDAEKEEKVNEKN